MQADDFLLLLLLLLATSYYLCYYRETESKRTLWYKRPQQLFQEQGRISSLLETRDIALRLTQTGAKVLILWSSQTGTSEDAAIKLGQELRSRYQLRSLVTAASDYSAESFSCVPKSTVIIFFMSTYGEGNPADDGTHFMKWVGEEAGSVLQGFPFAAVGYGNSTYKFYNRVIDSLEARLAAVGAQQLVTTLRLDASRLDCDDAYLQWKFSLFRNLREIFKVKELQVEGSLNYSVTRSSQPQKLEGDRRSRVSRSRACDSNNELLALPIKQALRITCSAVQSCLHFEVDLSTYATLKYRTGDYILVMPSNPANDVAKMLELCGLTASRTDMLEITSHQSSGSNRVEPTLITTTEDLLTSVLDISSKISRNLIAKLARYSPTPEAYKYMVHISEDNQAFLGLGSLSIVRFLEFISPIAQWPIPVAFMLEYLPRLKPRYYSISSSSVQDPRRATLTVSVKHRALGVATRYLLSKLDDWGRRRDCDGLDLTSHHQSLTIRATLKTSKFRLPLSSRIPIILIATGSGIAPFRAFIHERARIKQMRGSPSGKILLFMGCRRPEDFPYGDELRHIQIDIFSGEMQQMQIVTSYSEHNGKEEVQQGNHEKSYVQDKVQEHSKEVLRMFLRDNAAIYICGHVAMARSVTQVVGRAVMEDAKFEEDGWAELQEMKRKQRKWQEDVW